MCLLQCLWPLTIYEVLLVPPLPAHKNISAHCPLFITNHLGSSLWDALLQQRFSEVAGHAEPCVPARCHRFTLAFRDEAPCCHQLLSSNLCPLVYPYSCSLFYGVVSCVLSLFLTSNPFCSCLPLFLCIFSFSQLLSTTVKLTGGNVPDN